MAGATTYRLKPTVTKRISNSNFTKLTVQPPILFPRRLEQHVEEALIHKAMESLKGIKINRPLLKEIRQTDDYAKHIKNLVENKSRISEDEDVKMNTSCSAILHNQLPPKEQDPGSFTLPCSIGKLTFNALADLGASISVSLFRCSKEPRDKIDYSKLDQIKPWEIEAKKELNEERKIDISSVAKLKEHWCTLLDNIKEKCYWCCMNDDKRIDVAWEGLSLNDWIKRKISPNTREDRKDLENLRDAKIELILDNVYDKLDDDWFNGTVIDEEDLDRIVDYLELKSYDGFIDVDDKAYKKKRCEFLGMTYETPTPILIEKVEITRAELMKEMDAGGSVQREA
ncbi:hypothetical protein Tco_0397898 [Tanacetum coccineum]